MAENEIWWRRTSGKKKAPKIGGRRVWLKTIEGGKRQPSKEFLRPESMTHLSLQEDLWEGSLWQNPHEMLWLLHESISKSFCGSHLRWYHQFLNSFNTDQEESYASNPSEEFEVTFLPFLSICDFLIGNRACIFAIAKTKRHPSYWNMCDYCLIFYLPAQSTTMAHRPASLTGVGEFPTPFESPSMEQGITISDVLASIPVSSLTDGIEDKHVRLSSGSLRVRAPTSQWWHFILIMLIMQESRDAFEKDFVDFLEELAEEGELASSFFYAVEKRTSHLLPYFLSFWSEFQKIPHCCDIYFKRDSMLKMKSIKMEKMRSTTPWDETHPLLSSRFSLRQLLISSIHE